MHLVREIGRELGSGDQLGVRDAKGSHHDDVQNYRERSTPLFRAVTQVFHAANYVDNQQNYLAHPEHKRHSVLNLAEMVALNVNDLRLVLALDGDQGLELTPLQELDGKCQHQEVAVQSADCRLQPERCRLLVRNNWVESTRLNVHHVKFVWTHKEL